MSTTQPEPTEEEMRAAYEAELARIRVEHVLLEQVVTLVNLGMRRTGLAPGTEHERDPEQVRLAIEALRALMPVVEPLAADQMASIRQALSQLQLAFVRIGGPPAAGEAPPAAVASPPTAAAPAAPTPTPTPTPAEPAEPVEPAEPGGPGPAQRSGRLWVPGQ